MAKLILKFKEAVLKEIPLDKPVMTIGRALHNDIVIDNLAVSGSHARIVTEGERYYIEDLNSTNGTYINDRRIARHHLDNSSTVTVGKHTLQFILPEVRGTEPTLPGTRPVGPEATMMITPGKRQEPGGVAGDTAPPGASAPRPELRGIFTVIEGAAEQQEYELRHRVTTIGKADTAEIRLKGFFAPKIAALVNRTKDGYVLSPAGNEKRPHVNGKVIEGPTLLRDLDMVEVGNLKLQFSLIEE